MTHRLIVQKKNDDPYANEAHFEFETWQDILEALAKLNIDECNGFTVVFGNDMEAVRVYKPNPEGGSMLLVEEGNDLSDR